MLSWHLAIQDLDRLHITYFRDASSVTDVLNSETYKNEKLVFKGGKATNLCNSMINALTKAMDARFPGSDFISATMISSFINWPHIDPDKDKGFKLFIFLLFF